MLWPWMLPTCPRGPSGLFNDTTTFSDLAANVQRWDSVAGAWNDLLCLFLTVASHFYSCNFVFSLRYSLRNHISLIVEIPPHRGDGFLVTETKDCNRSLIEPIDQPPPKVNNVVVPVVPKVSHNGTLPKVSNLVAAGSQNNIPSAAASSALPSHQPVEKRMSLNEDTLKNMRKSTNSHLSDSQSQSLHSLTNNIAASINLLNGSQPNPSLEPRESTKIQNTTEQPSSSSSWRNISHSDDDSVSPRSFTGQWFSVWSFGILRFGDQESLF